MDIKIDYDDIKSKITSSILNFFRHWKKYWIIILSSFITTIYGFHLLVENQETGNGLTAITISVAILGWLITSNAADENLRRVKRIEYLSAAYEGIALYIRRDPQDPEYSRYLDGLEKSFTIIQLCGKRKEINLVCALIEQFHLDSNGNIQCEPLLNMLRDGLRKELMLAKSVHSVNTLRLHRPIIMNAETQPNPDGLIIKP